MISIKLMTTIATTMVISGVAAIQLIPAQGQTGNGSIVLSNINFESVDVMVKKFSVITFFYLIQLVRFLTIPLRMQLEETEELRRIKRLYMMLVRASMAAG